MNLEKKDISVIIPCYNTKPEFLQEAVSSVHAYKGNYSYEIIITNDGSTDQSALAVLNNLSRENITILHQENKGPAAARNAGVKQSHSEFILFLDSDNKIYAEYIDEGINALKRNSKAAVAYGNPHFSGNTDERNFEAGNFNIHGMLTGNYIDTCSVVRRQAWESVNGMDEERLLIGHEDWEFWISLYEAGWEFIHIDKTLFEYRISPASLITQTDKEDFFRKLGYIYQKHSKVVYNSYLHLYGQQLTYKADVKRPLRSFIKYSKKKYLD